MASFTKNIGIEKLKPAKKVSADILMPRLIFIISVIALILFGLVMVFSASNAEALNNNDSPYSYLIKQGLFCIVGLIGAFILWRIIPFSVWRSNITWIVFGVLFVFMLATLFAGRDALGARRWIYIGSMSFQPSEFAKISLVLLVAKLCSDFYAGKITGPRFAVTGLLSVLIMIIFICVGQSDLGTTIICVIGVIAVLWIAHAPKILIGAIVAFVFLFALAAVGFSSYRSSRFAFLDPYNDGAGGYGAGYQIIRSYYALAEGGLAGLGLGNSFEKFQYLPEAETDFIFSIIGEELGLIGATFVLVLFLIFLISGLYISLNSKTRFGASVSGALVVMIVFQAVLNIACVVGFFPTTGKPLPFISSGGSSLMASLVMVGLILAASEDDSKPDLYERRRDQFKAVGVSDFFKFGIDKGRKILENTNKNQRVNNQEKLNTRKSMYSSEKTKKPISKPNTRSSVRKPLVKSSIDTANIKQPSFIDKNSRLKNRKVQSTARPTVKRQASARKSINNRYQNSKNGYKARRGKKL